MPKRKASSTKMPITSYNPATMAGQPYNKNGSKTIPLSATEAAIWGHQEEIKIEYWDGETENDTKLAFMASRNTRVKKLTCKNTKELMHKVREENGWGGLATSSLGSIALQVARNKDANFPVYHGQAAPCTKAMKDVGYWAPQIEGHTLGEREAESNKARIDRGLKPYEESFGLVIRQDRVEFPYYGGIIIVDKDGKETYKGASFWKVDGP